MFKNKKGQSTLEYIILMTAVVVAIIAFTTNTFRPALNTTLTTGTNAMNTMSGHIGDAIGN